MKERTLYTLWKNSTLQWKLIIVAGFSMLSILMLFLFSVGFAPLNRMKEYEGLVARDTLLVEEYRPIHDHPDLRGLVRDVAYNQALLGLSEGDSIQLAVNLADSAVNLYLKGVKIHEIRIRQFRMDDFMEKIPNIQYVKLFASPVKVHSQHATIVKEPIVVREAPKDPEEAALNAWKPDTLVQNPAFLRLSLEHGINLVFEQDENPGLRDKWVRFTFRTGMKTGNLAGYSRNFLTLKKLEYHPTLVIRLPAEELRALYRALPGNAEVVLCFKDELKRR